MKITDTMEKTWKHLIKAEMTSEGVAGLMRYDWQHPIETSKKKTPIG